MTTEPDPSPGGAVKSQRMKLSNTSDQTETNDKGPCLSLRLFAARNALWAAFCSFPRLLQPQHLPSTVVYAWNVETHSSDSPLTQKREE